MNEPAKLAKGVYLRGDTYWLNFQVDGKRRFITLETSDPLEALRRASEMRAYQFPDGPTPIGMAIERYLAEKKRLNIYSKPTARVHGAVLDEFAKRVGGKALETITER